MKTIIACIVGLVAVVAVAVMAFPWLGDMLFEKKQNIDTTFRDGVSDGYVVDQAKTDINKLRELVKENYVNVTEAKQALSAQEAKRANMQKQLAANESAIQKASMWLQNHKEGDLANIRGYNYTYGDIVKDVQSRVNNCKTLRLASEGMDKGIDALRGRIALAESNIHRSLNYVREIEGKLEAKKAELAAYEAVKRTMSIVNDFKFHDINGDDITGKYIRELDRRLTRYRVEQEFESLDERVSGAIPWDGEQVNTGLGAMEEYMAKYMAPQNEAPEIQEETMPQVQDNLESPLQ